MEGSFFTTALSFHSTVSLKTYEKHDRMEANAIHTSKGHNFYYKLLVPKRSVAHKQAQPFPFAKCRKCIATTLLPYI
jgi:hypothetical protein